jgi:hypothetical protein
MLLFSLGLHPFLRMPEERLPGIRIGRSQPVSVVAYADDVTIFLTSVDDMRRVENAITVFERASGARLNVRKSMALPVGPWRSLDCVRGCEYRDKVRILGVTFWGITHRSATEAWNRVAGHVKMLAAQAYSRALCLAQRIRFVHTYLLAIIWYVALFFLRRQRSSDSLTLP